MSKKTRKKSSKKSLPQSSKTSAGKPAATKPVRASAKAAVKTKASTTAKAKAKASKAVAKKSPKPAKTAAAKGKAAAVKESHKPASKPLKSNPSPAQKPAAPKPEPAAAAIEGAKAPGFRLPRDGGDSVSLADYAGQKLVLFFYPRADTPGCTREAIDFTRLKDVFTAAETAVLGISADTVKAQESFRNKHQLAIPLISDEQHEMLEAYGAWGEKSMYGRSFMGIIRTTVLIGANGRIAKIWRHVRVDGHADEVLAAARELTS
ncbi:peroxiredoxin [Bradyrhizobium sp. KBS0727]|uniref:peroxiredoxin n=1 Tax=unclassified Bradyrhizobium TaxID=2631580 RepID=UPI00110D7DC1|nr:MULTISPECIES: peroxiredoxin [unclassified Bradyrhizobium]QDW42018.1 peroxiredoxin [Bradyrhizobium sp. KBS0725]QDW48623.1 peroxiredoxin [Bradyrhizobium sp. KBS0727]